MFSKKTDRVIVEVKTQHGTEVINMRGFIRISTNGVLQIMSEPTEEGGKPMGRCVLAVSDGNWISAKTA